MRTLHDHLLAETLASDGIAVRWSRLNVITADVGLVWALIVAMEALYVASLYTSARAQALFAFFATYAVVLTMVAR